MGGSKEESTKKIVAMRRRAEALSRENAALSSEDIEALSPEQIGQILHELRVHQIELEMQNQELHQVQAELDAAGARYFELYDLAPVGYCTVSEQGLILEANLTLSSLLGVPMERLTMQPISRFILKEDQDSYYQYARKLFKTGESDACELRMQKKGGIPLWVLLNGTASQACDSAMVCRVTISDITRCKETEDAKKEKNIAEQALAEIKKLKARLELEKEYLQEEIKLEHNHDTIIGQSNALKYVLYKIEQIAAIDTIVLILGETGTGKELVARAIHNLSQRKTRPMVKVNCASLSATVIESELFGHEKGSFTGSYSRHLGRFEVADGSTLFLDEIGELPLDLQAKLLRVLQDGEFERLGSSQTIRVDTRIIVATNRNLEEEVKQGRFREDLWYRLNIFPITMPPLRDRKEDIPLLVKFYVKKISRRIGKSIKNIPQSIMDTLQNYHWPGNIRELQNVIERGVINSSGEQLHLVDELLEKESSRLGRCIKTLEEIERDYIIQILEQTGWKVSGKNSATTILGLNRSTLRARMRKFDIQKP